jgi:hypothetical protein
MYRTINEWPLLYLIVFQVGGFSYKEDGSDEMESLKNQKGEEEAENFVFQESGNEYYNRPDERKGVTISVRVDEEIILICDKINHFNPIPHGIFLSWLPRGGGFHPPYGKSTSECLSPILFLHSQLYIYRELRSKRFFS